MTKFMHAWFLWLITAPSMMVMYTLVSLKEWLLFMFNAPLDVWDMINEALDEQAEEEDEETA